MASIRRRANPVTTSSPLLTVPTDQPQKGVYRIGFHITVRDGKTLRIDERDVQETLVNEVLWVCGESW